MNKSKSIFCKQNDSLVLKDDGTIEWWGSTKNNQYNPVYKTFTGVISLACGSFYSVALKVYGAEMSCCKNIPQNRLRIEYASAGNCLCALVIHHHQIVKSPDHCF